MDKKHIFICAGTGCISSNSNLIIEKFNTILNEKGINNVEVTKTGCFGLCSEGPILRIEPDDIIYVQVSLDDIEEIVESHLIKGEVVERLLHPDAKENNSEISFYTKQYRIALRNSGEIDPENIDDYINKDGYVALKKVLLEMTPSEVISEIKNSGLRGRGGGGFPTGLKWELTRKSESDKKYMICNADEGDPGAFMDRAILEGDPHSVLEAMIIAGYAIGANNGIVYIRAEYPLAIKRLEIAIEQMKERNFLGSNILDSGFDFNIKIALGAGAFVCGEETALISSVSGNRGEPMKKPPYPSTHGIEGKPTCVNNVETLANIPKIITLGADWFNKIGTEKSKGTKVFALAGKVKNVGLVEVPMGTTLREIIYDIGGGIIGDKEFKAVQTGGPSGGVITKDYLDTEIDYDSLVEIGSMMGSGGMIVMDEDDDMVEISKFYLDFTTDESCGKCTPCRIGTMRLYEILERLTNLEGSMEDVEKLEVLSKNIKSSSLCGLGQSAPNPVLSTLNHFRDEYERYARREIYSKYSVISEKCVGCTACARVCPVDCISGSVKEIHVIDEDICIACGACFDACKFDAIKKPLGA